MKVSAAVLRKHNSYWTEAARQCSHCWHALQKTQTALQLHCSHITGWTVISQADTHSATMQGRLYVEHHTSE